MIRALAYSQRKTWRTGKLGGLGRERESMELRDFFKQYEKLGLAFSGGTDSAYLLYAALSAEVEVTAYYVKTPFQPAFELADARRLCEELNAKLVVLELDILSDERICRNPPERCYYCKKRMMGAIMERAMADGCQAVMDGTNASDDSGDRPGMRALKEQGVLSPLRDCGIGKPELRERSRQAGLFTWDKPAYACLATRIPTGADITGSGLARIERAETGLYRLGFRDFRVRSPGAVAKLQVRQEQLPLVLEKREEILHLLGTDYKDIVLDLNTR